MSSISSVGNRHGRWKFRNGESQSRLKALTCSAKRAGIWLYPNHLRITEAFLLSARALSLVCRARDLVNVPTCSFFNSAATLWLTYSEPLSAWKPLTSKGKASIRASSTGIRKASEIACTVPTYCHCVTSSTTLM